MRVPLGMWLGRDAEEKDEGAQMGVRHGRGPGGRASVATRLGAQNHWTKTMPARLRVEVLGAKSKPCICGPVNAEVAVFRSRKTA